MLKKHLRNSAVYTILGFLPLSFAFFFTPVYTRYLSQSEYGMMNIFMVLTGILAPYYALGVGQSFGVVYWDYHKEEEKFKHFMASTLGSIIVFGFSFMLLATVFHQPLFTILIKSHDTFHFFPYQTMTLIYPFVMTFNTLLLYYYRNEHKIWHYSALSVLNLLLVSSLSVFSIVILKQKSGGAIIARTFGTSVIVLGFTLSLIRKYGVRFDKATIWMLLKIGFPLFVATLIGSYSYNADRILVERFGNLSILGIYGFAVVIVSTIEIWMNALINSLAPTMYRFMVEDIHKNKEKIHLISQGLVLMVYLAVVVVIAMTNPILHLLIPKGYYSAANYVPLLAAGFLIRSITVIYTHIFYLKKKTKYLPILSAVYSVLVFSLGYTFFRWLGIPGIAASIIICRAIDLLLNHFLAMRAEPFNFGFFKLYIVGGIVMASIFCIYPLHEFVNIYFLYTVPLILFLISSFLLLHKDIMELVHTYQSNLKTAAIAELVEEVEE